MTALTNMWNARSILVNMSYWHIIQLLERVKAIMNFMDEIGATRADFDG